MIVFDPVEHRYTNTDTGEDYISATTILGKYKPKFDAEGMAARVAKRDGLTKEVVLETWAAITKKATDKGSLVHKMLEDYILSGIPDERIPWLFQSFDKCILDTVERYFKVHSEKLLYNHQYKIAGTADLIFDQGNYFTVGDFKTNKAFTFHNKYNEFHLAPIDHLICCEFNSYALQLSLYAYMYELISGKKCRKLFIMYLRADKRTFDIHHVNYLKAEVMHLLNDYASKSS
jgi:hypothetical protein